MRRAKYSTKLREARRSKVCHVLRLGRTRDLRAISAVRLASAVQTLAAAKRALGTDIHGLVQRTSIV